MQTARSEIGQSAMRQLARPRKRIPTALPILAAAAAVAGVAEAVSEDAPATSAEAAAVLWPMLALFAAGAAVTMRFARLPAAALLIAIALSQGTALMTPAGAQASATVQPATAQGIATDD